MERRRLLLGLVVGSLALTLAVAGAPASERGHGWSSGVDSWVTDPGSDQRLARQPALLWRPGPGSAADAVLIDPTRRYQTMIGFGASMTDSSAYLIARLPAGVRTTLMADLFSSRDGIGLSVLRQPMGGSDFSVGRPYSYDDQPTGETDPDLSDFSIDRDRAQILPRLREAYALNTGLRFVASPWSPPGWMKDTDSLVTGSLLPRYYDAYARYFVAFIQAYEDAGIPTDYVTVQNEPLYAPMDSPGTFMLPDQAAAFLSGHLGPALRQAGLDTEILGYDHNWDIPDYPEYLYADRGAAHDLTGTAWHCYDGPPTAQSVTHNDYPHAQTFLTECSGGTWQGTQQQAFDRTMDTVVGGPRQWAQSVILWNLALDQHNGPHVGGCRTCRGVVTVNTDTGTVTRNVDYWALGHASRFVAPGAVRIGSSQPTWSPIVNVGFRNADGSLVLIAHNRARQTRTFDIRVGDRHVTATLAAGAAATYLFRAPDRLVRTGDLGWVDLDYGRGPVGTPSGRLTASVGPEVIAAMRQVRLGDRWLAYGFPYGAELQPSGPVTTLDRASWRLRADGVSPDEDHPLTNALDGDPRTAWNSGEGQNVNQSLTIDLGRDQTVTELSLEVGAAIGDYLRSYQVEVFDDRAGWRSVARGPGRTGEMIIPLPPTTARLLRITSTGSSASRWSIAELNVRQVEPNGIPGPVGADLVGPISASGRLGDGSRVIGYYNGGDRTLTVPWPMTGLGYTYRLPPTAAATFVVLAG